MLSHQQSNKNLTTHNQAYGTEGASSKDLVLPRLIIAQASADICKEGLVRPGELVHSQTKEVLAHNGEGFEFLPITLSGTIEITTTKPPGGGFADFIRSEKITKSNDTDKWVEATFDEDGSPILRNKKITVLLLPIKKLDGFPFYMDFKSGNKDAAKLISTVVQENGFAGKPAFDRVISITTRLKKYKNNSWFITTVTPGRAATEKEIEKCMKWYDTFKNSTEESLDEEGLV